MNPGILLYTRGLNMNKSLLFFLFCLGGGGVLIIVIIMYPKNLVLLTKAPVP